MIIWNLGVIKRSTNAFPDTDDHPTAGEDTEDTVEVTVEDTILDTIEQDTVVEATAGDGVGAAATGVNAIHLLTE